MVLAMLAWTDSSRAALLWSDLGATQVHETGPGTDILGGGLRRNNSSTDTLYFKFHVDPLSDASTELYFAGFQLFEGNQERLAVGNALNAFAYSAFSTGQTGQSNNAADYGIDLKSSKPDASGIGTFYTYELVHSGIERTIVFKVQYVAGGDDLVTVWLDPDLRPGATETNQLQSLTTQFKANASFDQIHLRHGGGGAGWIFSEMAIATSFDDFVNGNGSATEGSSLGIGYGEVPFTFRSWQREQGLPENYVRALAQTRDGYLWVGSDDGVSRFDGVSFFSLGLQEGFQSGPVQVLFGDSHGALWIGSVGGGLSCWQGGKLRTFTVRDGLPSDSITALAEDSSGRLWVGTQAGLVVLQDGRLTSSSGAGIFSGKPITTLFSDRNGTMWVGAAGAGVFAYQRGEFVQLRDPASRPPLPAGGSSGANLDRGRRCFYPVPGGRSVAALWDSPAPGHALHQRIGGRARWDGLGGIGRRRFVSVQGRQAGGHQRQQRIVRQPCRSAIDGPGRKTLGWHPRRSEPHLSQELVGFEP
jgi:hypothetical protein